VGKARKALKYSAAGTITTLYGLALHRLLTRTEPSPVMDPVKAVATVTAMTGLTWLATTL
jgi:hypothetical protein